MNILNSFSDHPSLSPNILNAQLLDILPCGVSIATDVTCETIIHNPIAAKFYRIEPFAEFSLSAKEPPPVKIYENGKLLSAEEMPIQQATWYGKEIRGCTLEFVWNDGISRIARYSASPLRDKEGIIIGCIATMEDLTDIVNMTRDLEKHTIHLEDLIDEHTFALKLSEKALVVANTELENKVSERTLELQEKNMILEAEIEKVKATENALRDSEEKYRSLFNSIDVSFCIIEMIFDTEGKPVDWCYMETNSAFKKQIPLKDVEGKCIRDLIPDQEARWFEIYGKVALTGEAVRFVCETKALNRWYDLYAFKIGGSDSRKVAVLFNNITERKQIEEKLSFQADLLSSVHDAIVATDEKDNFIYWNAMAEKIFGWSAQEIMGQSLKKKFPRNISATRMEANTKLRKEGCYIGEIEYRNKDGALINTDSHIKMIINHKGEYKGVVGTYRDITQRKQLEKDLEDSRGNLIAEVDFLKRLHLISTNLIQSHEDPMKLFNEILVAAIELTNASKGTFQLLDKKTDNLQYKAQRGVSDQFMHHFKSVSQDRGACGLAYKNKARVIVEDVTQSPIFMGTQDLQVILDEGTLSIQSTPLISSSGNFMGVLSTHYETKHQFDDKELRMLDLLAQQAADAIERTISSENLTLSRNRALTLVEELSSMDKNKNRFLSMLSHELRNPLASIRMSISLLDRVEPDGEKARKAKEVMKRQTDQLTRLVDDLLDVTRITQNKVTLKKERLNLNEIISRAVEDYRGQFEKQKVRLEVELSPSPLYLEADPARLTQVIGNLLHNAAKFTSKGDNTHLTVWKAEDKQEAVICVKDNGLGVKPDVLPDLFFPFIQVDSSLDRNQGGLGLGLAIVKGMVELHGGRVTAASEGIGKGAEFTICLPLPTGTNNNQVKQPQAGEKPSRALRILVIDDIPDVAEILCSLLRELGHEVISANNGSEGIAKAKAFYPEVLLCDIGMQGMNGYEVAENFRRDPKLKDIFLIALTGFAQSNDLERAKEAGFNRHLAKPVDLDTLEQILTEIS